MTKNQNKTETYLKSMLNESSWEKELIAYAENHNVPIIEPISMNFIVSLIKLSQPINILEIGTAIGYSALSMHYGLPNAHITTLERNEDMFNRSEEHTSELQSRGHLVCRLLLEKKKKKSNKIS